VPAKEPRRSMRQAASNQPIPIVPGREAFTGGAAAESAEGRRRKERFEDKFERWTIFIPSELRRKVEEERDRTGTPAAHIVAEALRRYFDPTD
jgi:hypothetical protein